MRSQLLVTSVQSCCAGGGAAAAEGAGGAAAAAAQPGAAHPRDLGGAPRAAGAERTLLVVCSQFNLPSHHISQLQRIRETWEARLAQQVWRTVKCRVWRKAGFSGTQRISLHFIHARVRAAPASAHPQDLGLRASDSSRATLRWIRHLCWRGLRVL